jgi:plastocyanin
MSAGRLFTYATWAAFMATGTLFVTGLTRNGEQTRHVGAGTPSLRISPPGRGYRPPPPREVPIRIDVYEYGFAPSNTIIKVGQAIAFHGVGNEIHSIIPASTAGYRAFRDANEQGSGRPIFTKPGVFPFTCAIHHQMKGTVTVVSHF